MRSITNLRLIILCLALASCCSGNWGDDLYLKGNALSAVTGTGADNSEVMAALSELMEGRLYDADLYMMWGCKKQDHAKLTNTPVITYVAAGDQSTGTGLRRQGRYLMEFTLPGGQQLSLDLDFNSAQGLVNAVKPRQSPETSAQTIQANCVLTGTLAGETVDLAFQQQISSVRNAGFAGHF